MTSGRPRKMQSFFALFLRMRAVADAQCEGAEGRTFDATHRRDGARVDHA